MDAPRATIQKAKALRRRMSPPEVALWNAIRGKRLAGHRFRRQHPLGPFVLDFYCDASGLAVEVDGQGHGLPAQIRHDIERDAWLAERGVEVLRVPASDVKADIDGVCRAILMVLDTRPHRPCGPLPPRGEET